MSGVCYCEFMVPISDNLTTASQPFFYVFWVSKSPVSLRNNLDSSPTTFPKPLCLQTLSADDFPPQSTKNVGACLFVSAAISLSSVRGIGGPNSCSRLIYLLVNQLVHINYLLRARYRRSLNNISFNVIW